MGAKYDFKELEKKYAYFDAPVAVIKVAGKDIGTDKLFAVSDIEIELTSGYEASIASFCIFNAYDKNDSKFKTEDAKKYILIGSKVEIALGYGASATEVFVGVITRVRFHIPPEDVPYIEVTCMDVKGIMMANNHSKSLTSTNYGDAVKEVLTQNAYQNLSNSQIIKDIVINDTPDKKQSGGGDQQKATDRTMEFVAESDYEFVVRAAKKYNYDFFTECGTVYFRKAKSDTTDLIELTPSTGAFRSYDLEYDVTGLVETIQTRGMETGKAKLITGKAKFSNKISLGSKAKKLISKTEKIYVDPTITSKEEADARAKSILESISYRFGTLECELIGLPEILPGHFFTVKQFGAAVGNTFYIDRVRHLMRSEGGFVTQVTGKCAKLTN